MKSSVPKKVAASSGATDDYLDSLLKIQPYDTQLRYLDGMLLSFVVPAYNEEAYLGACLESILDQTRGLER